MGNQGIEQLVREMGDMEGLKGKEGCEVEIKATPEKFYKMFKETAFHVPTIAGDHIQAVDVHDGDWDSHDHGSIKVWKYTVDGVSGEFKEKVEFDDENLKVTLVGVEGDVFKEYKSFVPVYHVVPNPNGEGSLAKLSIEYEKLNSDVPPPTKYVGLMVNITKDIDAHLVPNN